MDNLKFKVASDEITKLIEDIGHLSGSIQNKEVISIIDEFNNKISTLQEKIELEIAFVGQYSSGKSTIISALSGNMDIKIGQDVTTDSTQAYPWGKVLLVDTPGIHAGRPEHDAISIEYMNRADLLVYVITSHGFTSKAAENFRQLAFTENRIDKIMLVINKSSQGDKETALKNWISDALKVTEPKTEDDLFLSVTDAKDYLDALDTDDQKDKLDLIEYSGFNKFIKNLNEFISQKGILGQLITPLNVVQDYLNRIINNLTADNENSQNQLEFLNRSNFRLIKSKKNITDIINGHINSLVFNIKKEGNRIASIIEKDCNKEILELECENSNETINDLIVYTNENINQLIEDEFSQLKFEFKILMESELAQTLLNQESIKANFNTSIGLHNIDKNKLESGINILDNIQTLVDGFVIKDTGSIVTKGLKAMSGSDTHKLVYKAGKFFNHSFKPYEALKYADKIANISKGIGKIASKATIVLPTLVAIYEEYAEIKDNEKIKEKKQEVRQSFDKIAKEIKTDFQKNRDKFVVESYDKKLKEIDTDINKIRNSDMMKEENVLNIQKLLDRSNSILNNLVNDH